MSTPLTPRPPPLRGANIGSADVPVRGRGGEDPRDADSLPSPSQGGGVGGGGSDVLRVEGLEVHYRTPRGPVKAVNGVSFTLKAGERLGLIGESGSGKTTMGTALMRLTRPPGRIVGGQVYLNGRDLLGVPERELRRIRMREIALVPQGAMSSLNPVMRIREQILDGIVAHEGELPSAGRADRVSQALGRVGLPIAIADRFPHELSGGQKQRVAIAIATVLSPSVIVADEPTSALDVVVQRQVIMTLGRVQEGLGAAVILIGHDMGLIAQFADTIGVLYAGELVEYGPIDDVMDDPQHPYTRLLIESLPSLDVKRELRGIPGLPPALLDLPPGCPFAPRCPHVFEPCLTVTPPLRTVAAERRVACHLYDGTV
jgi:peptide/nickel transport system ATP-binding protein